MKQRSAILIVLVALVATTDLVAQRGGRGGGGSPRTAAAIDLTGYWVSVITEDWKFRMVTPKKGVYETLTLNAQGRKVADSWDPARDEASGEACRAYGAGNIMRMPTRLHVTWADDTTLKLETDTGQQTRLFTFGNAAQPPAEATFQGFSRAAWELPGGGGGRGRGRGAAGARPGASMRVTTSRMKLGYFRRNGVPYGPNATMTEWFTTLSEPDGNTYLLVTKILEDPQYLNGPYVRSVQFKKENGTAGWNPTPCQ